MQPDQIHLSNSLNTQNRTEPALVPVRVLQLVSRLETADQNAVIGIGELVNGTVVQRHLGLWPVPSNVTCVRKVSVHYTHTLSLGEEKNGHSHLVTYLCRDCGIDKPSGACHSLQRQS